MKRLTIELRSIFEKNDIYLRLENYNKKMLDANFWQNKAESKKIVKEKKLFEDLLYSHEKSVKKLKDLDDLNELAIGSGMGFRYDFGFFVLRFDVGFKTYEPYLKNKKWLRNYNFQNAVYNVGINYPF